MPRGGSSRLSEICKQNIGLFDRSRFASRAPCRNTHQNNRLDELPPANGSRRAMFIATRCRPASNGGLRSGTVLSTLADLRALALEPVRLRFPYGKDLRCIFTMTRRGTKKSHGNNDLELESGFSHPPPLRTSPEHRLPC